MKKIILFAALMLSVLTVRAQKKTVKPNAAKLIAAIEKTYSSTSRPGDLRTNETFKNELRQVINMADAHTVYVVNKYSTFIYMNGMMPNVAQAIAKMPATLKSSDEGRKMVNYYYSMRTLKVGDKVPDFTMPTPDGKQVNLYSYLKKNKCTVLDFWASWCHWCRAENPNLKKTYEAFKDKGCGFLSFSFDDKRDRWTKAIEEDKNPWTQVSDLKGCEGANCSDVYKQFDINGIPAILLLDSQGKVIQLRMRGDQIYNSVNDYLSQRK